MDPVLGTVLGSFIASAAAIIIAVINARSSADKLASADRERRKDRKIIELGGDPDDI